MPSTEKYLAFTISNLIASDDGGLLDILDRNLILPGPNENRRVSLGWIFKFGDDETPDTTRLPHMISQLVMDVTVTDEAVGIEFSEIDVTTLFGGEGAVTAPTLNQYTQEKIVGSNYLSKIKQENNSHDLEYNDATTKAVFFSRTQLLLFRSMLQVSASNSLTNELLFSGYKLDTGNMTALRNMAEQALIAKDSPEMNAKEWFTLKAELWPTVEDDRSEATQGATTNNLEDLKEAAQAAESTARTAEEVAKNTPSDENTEAAREASDAAEAAKQALATAEANIATTAFSSAKEDAVEQARGEAEELTEGQASDTEAEELIEGQARDIFIAKPATSVCSDIKQAMHPLLSFAQPCPPGWGAKGIAGETALPYLSSIPDFPVTSFLAQLLCTLQFAFLDVAEGKTVKGRSVTIPKTFTNEHSKKPKVVIIKSNPKEENK